MQTNIKTPINWPNKTVSLALAGRLIHYAQANGVRHLLDAGDVFDMTRVELADFVTRNARLLPPVPHGLKPAGPSVAVFDDPCFSLDGFPSSPCPAAPAVVVNSPPVPLFPLATEGNQ